MVSIDMRLKVRHWFKKYRKIFLIVILVWGVIFMINRYLGDYKIEEVPNTTYTPTVSVMNDNKSLPKKTHTAIETMIDEYVGYCNEGNYQKAFNMLTEDCRKYAFDDNLETFASHVLTKMPTPKKHSIQNYSNYDDYIIYDVRYIDDILTTGLTDTEYSFTEEKMVFTKNSDGSYDMNTGNFVKYEKIGNVMENDYLKVDVRSRIVRYSIESYEIKFTNRTDSTVVVKDSLEKEEVNLVLRNEYRNSEDGEKTIVLEPGESKTYTLNFTKFSDDNDKAEGILFGAVRVMETYSGFDAPYDIQQQEIANAIAKFSMQVPVN